MFDPRGEMVPLMEQYRIAYVLFMEVRYSTLPYPTLLYPIRPTVTTITATVEGYLC